MSHVITHMLSRFRTLYDDPKTDDVDGYLMEYVHALDGASPEVLNAATDSLVRKNRYRKWPTIGECMDEVTRIADERANDKRRLHGDTYIKRNSMLGPPDAEQLERQRLGKEWRDQMEREYGSVEKAIEAHQRKRNAIGMASKKSTFKKLTLSERSRRMMGESE
jgi:hypothetical protein